MTATAAPIEYGLTTLAIFPTTAPIRITIIPVTTSYPADTKRGMMTIAYAGSSSQAP